VKMKLPKRCYNVKRVYQALFPGCGDEALPNAPGGKHRGSVQRSQRADHKLSRALYSLPAGLQFQPHRLLRDRHGGLWIAP
jgi:hypothetical protein